MDSFKISIENIQHIELLKYEIDLTQNKIHCIVGKNSTGKTTLIKSIQNLIESDTLEKFSRLNIVNKQSKIAYTIDSVTYTFIPQQIADRYILDSKDVLNNDKKKQIYVELPIPYDKRFKTYQYLNEDYKNKKMGSISYKIQAEISIGNYTIPTELIALFNSIYNIGKFNNLKSINIGKDEYFVLLEDGYYIREDDFSSGEYMILQIYKFIKKGYKLLIIDELDISLDSRAQVNLIIQLQPLCQKYETNIIFTTHSLAMMKKVNELGESLYYMVNNNGKVDISIHSYNYIKSELFQFYGFDKIILTEDSIIKEYLEHLLKEFNSYKPYAIILCNSESETIKIFETNEINNIFGTKDIRIILDKDVESKYRAKNIFSKMNFIPFDDIEMQVLKHYKEGKISQNDNIDTKIKDIPKEKDKSKCLYKNIIDLGLLSKNKIFDLINDEEKESVDEFKIKLNEFLIA